MTLKRVGVGESPVRNRLSNGPLRAQSNDIFGVFCDAIHALDVKGMLVLKSA